MTENSSATQNVCSSILFAQMTLCVDLGPRANLTRIAVSSGNSARWGGSEHMNGLMTTSMTWVRDPRSTFRLPIFDKGDPALLCASQQNASPHVRFGSKADIGACPRHVRFTPKSGHREMRQGLARHTESSRRTTDV